MKQIAVVGSFVMDLIARVDAFPNDGQTIIGGAFLCLPGGKGANQAVAASRLGGSVQMFGRVGTDGYGETFLNVFKEANIDISYVKKLAEFPTAVGLIQIDNRAENRIVVIPGANYGYTETDLMADSEAIFKSDLVVTQLELRHEVTYKLIELCFEQGVPIVLNPAPAVKIPNEILKKVTYLTPNETELEILTDLKIETLDDAKIAITKLLMLGIKVVIATLGKNGALIGSNDGFRHIPGYTVEAIDTVAAGDSFNGALAVGIVEGKPMTDIVAYANAVGALTVTKHGAIPSLPYTSEVDAFMKR
jgi:ribokinase